MNTNEIAQNILNSIDGKKCKENIAFEVAYSSTTDLKFSIVNRIETIKEVNIYKTYPEDLVMRKLETIVKLIKKYSHE